MDSGAGVRVVPSSCSPTRGFRLPHPRVNQCRPRCRQLLRQARSPGCLPTTTCSHSRRERNRDPIPSRGRRKPLSHPQPWTPALYQVCRPALPAPWLVNRSTFLLTDHGREHQEFGLPAGCADLSHTALQSHLPPIRTRAIPPIHLPQRLSRISETRETRPSRYDRLDRAFTTSRRLVIRNLPFPTKEARLCNAAAERGLLRACRIADIRLLASSLLISVYEGIFTRAKCLAHISRTGKPFT